MKLVKYLFADKPGVGILEDNLIYDISDQFSGDSFLDAVKVSTENPIALKNMKSKAKVARSTEEIKILKPLCGGRIFCIGLNYKMHAREGGHNIPDFPIVFMRTESSLVGPGEFIEIPSVTNSHDYEAELAVVIGKESGRSASGSVAESIIAGYTCVNEGTLRDFQYKTPQWTFGKSSDRTGAIGPWLVTKDELPAGGSGLAIKFSKNGNTLQSGNTADMIFKVTELIEIISQLIELRPGDIISTGTPDGVGKAHNPPEYLKAGDTCRVEIEGIGSLVNGVKNAD